MNTGFVENMLPKQLKVHYRQIRADIEEAHFLEPFDEEIQRSVPTIHVYFQNSYDVWEWQQGIGDYKKWRLIERDVPDYSDKEELVTAS